MTDTPQRQRAVPELLLPAGTPRKLRVAYAYGADAAYVGAAGFSMRPDAASFTLEQLAEGVKLAHSLGKRLYVGINSMLFDDDLSALRDWLIASRDIALNAIIVADPGAMMLVKQHRPDVEIHISTQLSTANSEAASFWQAAGAARVILARECSLANAAVIAKHCNIPIEAFVHGAMCTAVSGRCLLSAHLTGKSGSRGECKHSCRWDWQLVEAKRPGQTVPVFEDGGQTIFLGSTDLCLIEHIPAVCESGLSSIKVEGRMKGEFYVATVARVYRAALDAWAGGSFQLDPQWLAELDTVTHQPYDTGFAFGYPNDDPARLQSPGRVEGTHYFVGIVESSQPGQAVVEVKRPFRIGESVEWIGPDYTSGEITIESITEPDGQPREQSHVGTTVTITFSPTTALPKLAIFRRPVD